MRLVTAGLAGLILLFTTGCGSTASDDSPESRVLTVYAAASLTATFEQLAAAFEAEHDDVEVEFNFAGSSDLVAQIIEGAPADVFASADEANMVKLTAEGLEGADPQPFATNTLQIVVPPGNPADIRTFADLAGDDVNLVVCAPEVPCGAAAAKVAQAAGVRLTPVSEEQSVADVLAKVSSGEADAGLVYVTDVAAAGDAVEGIAFDESGDAVNVYPIATVTDSQNAELADEFVSMVLGEEGQTVLADAGFGPPPGAGSHGESSR